jgi:hypothetical protein
VRRSALATVSATFAKTIGIVRVSRGTAAVAAVRFAAMMSGCRPTGSRARSYPIDTTAAPTEVHPQIAAIGPTQVRKRLVVARPLPHHDRGSRHHPIRSSVPRCGLPPFRAVADRNTGVAVNANIPPVIWWNNLERIMLAVDDLGCRDLLN